MHTYPCPCSCTRVYTRAPEPEHVAQLRAALPSIPSLSHCSVLRAPPPSSQRRLPPLLLAIGRYDARYCVANYCIYISWWHPASKNLLRLEAGYPALRCHILQNTDHTHNTHTTRTTTQPNTRTKHTTKPLSSDRRLRDDGACHLPRQGGWPRRSQHGKQGRSPTRPGAR